MKEQCKADLCVFQLIRESAVVMVVCVHVDGITLTGEPVACDFQSTCLLEEFQTMGGEFLWYFRCEFGRDRERGVLCVLQ